MTFHRAGLLLLALLLHAGVARADDVPATEPVGIRGDFSGTWFDPAQPGHGLTIEVQDGAQAIVAWYTFDAAGAPLWLHGMATVDGATLHVPLARVSGGRFPPDFDPADIDIVPWGEATLTFTGCDTGSIEWMPVTDDVEPGNMPLQRASRVHGTRCNVEETFGEQRVFAFERGTLGFSALFADYPPGENAFYELDYAFEQLPAPLGARRGVRLSGNNHSDDLAMLAIRDIGGLLPNTTYRLELDAEIASNVPSGCFGTGGSPGESVWIKLGASTQEPFTIADTSSGSTIKRLNIDYGQQAESGTDALVVGTMGNGEPCDDGVTTPWKLRTLSTQGQAFTARSDAEGTLWLIAGTDSGFESRTDVYLTALRVRMEPVMASMTRSRD